ncbi:MAG: outer membrane protein assembly factor BamA [Sphingomonadaceae bacterium]|nr:outer membrane protein assembly factor BamA [Sphingomonadaceae bacterium]
MTGTMLAGQVGAVHAQTVPVSAVPAPATPAPATPAPAPAEARVIRAISVVGNQRLEGDTVRTYAQLRVGQAYTRATLDNALRALSQTELFSQFQITDNDGALVIQVTENPVVNRVILEGNRRLDNDKIVPELRLAARQIYTRSRVRADVARILELYRRQGRYAASVDPQLVRLDQNRVDVVYEITEGDRSRVRQINIIGNNAFTDGELKGEMATKERRLTTFLSSNTTYDPDRLAYDQQKLRQFYLTQGYADFRVVSAVAELTSDRQDFIITYVVEEGERYHFGNVGVESDLRDFTPDTLQRLLPMHQGDWYNAKQVEDTVESLQQTAGLLGYAFAEVRPRFVRNRETRTMDIVFQVQESPRAYVERVDVNGNTLTSDKVVRREFRLNEGDAFNSFLVRRSQDRINSLGYFQDNLEIEQTPGSTPDRIILAANVEEKPTGELSLSAGFSSIENFILQGSIRQRNFRGMGQTISASVNYSNYSKSIELGFTEPNVFDRNISLSGQLFRRDYNSFNFINNNRNTTYQQVTTGLSLQAGVPLNEFMSLFLRYSLNFDDVTLDRNTFFFNGSCDPLLAGRYLCDSLGKRTTSLAGYSLVYDNRDNRLRPTRGYSFTLNQDFAGLGGSVRYLRTIAAASHHMRLFGDFILNASIEGGYIHPLGDNGAAPGTERIRLTDRFFLGEPQMRGFDIRGVGPRVVRYTDVDLTNPMAPVVGQDRRTTVDDAVGARAYYRGRLEVDIPLGSGAQELGLRPSIFMDVGALFSVRRPTLTSLSSFRDTDGNFKTICRNQTTGTIQFGTQANNSSGMPVGEFNQCPTGFSGIRPFDERYFGDTPSPRLSVGFGVNWNSPFGPLRIDIARALLREPGDDTKLFTFNVGTQF